MQSLVGYTLQCILSSALGLKRTATFFYESHVIQRTWQYVCDHNSEKNPLIFKNFVCCKQEEHFYTYANNMFILPK